MSAPFRVERRLDCPAWLNWAIPAGAVATALLAGALLLFFLGVSPGVAYKAMFKGALGDAWGVSETLVKAIPLSMAATTFRMSAAGIQSFRFGFEPDDLSVDHDDLSRRNGFRHGCHSSPRSWKRCGSPGMAQSRRVRGRGRSPS